MPAEDTIIAPRIVQPQPWRTISVLLLVMLGMGAAAFAGFEFGRRQAPAIGEAPADDFARLRGRVTALEAENADLLEHIQTLTSLRGEELAAAADAAPRDEEENETTEPGDENAMPEPDTPAAPPSPAAEQGPDSDRPTGSDAAAPAQGATTSAASAQSADAGEGAPGPQARDIALEIREFRLRPTNTADSVRFSFAVGLAGGGSGDVVGSIWIAVNGRSQGKPARLRLREATKDQSDFVRMRFKQRQVVEGEFVLPEGFSPSSVIVEAKPLEEERYQSATRTFDWKLSDG